MTRYESRRLHRQKAVRHAMPSVQRKLRVSARQSVIASRMLDGWSYEAAAGEAAGLVEAYGEDTRRRVKPLPPDAEEVAWQEALRLEPRYHPDPEEPEVVLPESRRYAARVLRILKLEGVIEAIYRRQQGLCAYCQQVLRTLFHVDHRTPIVRGGRTVEENLCCACPRCNLTKHAMTAEEFLPTQTGVS